MKIRNGFVSNSSSSSFCIIGIAVDYDMYSLVSKQLENHDQLDYDFSENDETYYIGIDIYSVKDNETLGEIKLKAKQLLSELFKDTKISNNISPEVFVDWNLNG